MFPQKIFIAIAVAGTVVLGGPATAGGGVQPVPASPSDLIDHYVEQRMQNAKIVGLGAAIIVNRKLVWSKGYGFADKERVSPFTEDTPGSNRPNRQFIR